MTSGRTKHPDLGDLAAFNGDQQMYDIYNFFDPLIGESKALVADLPLAAEYAGRTIFVLADSTVRISDGTDWLIVGGKMPTYAGRLTATVSLTNNLVTVVPAFTDITNLGGFVNSAGALTVPVTGEYAIEVTPTTVSGGSTHFSALLLNGSTSTERIAATSGSDNLNLSVVRKLSAGAVLRVQSYQNSGSTRTLADILGGATLPFLNIRYLGPA